MRVAVVGAGVFGATTAVDLAQAGHRVDLFERHRGLLCGASRANQGRLHRGYHYPRSPRTAAACQVGAREFAARFPAAIVSAGRNYYAIADDSPTTADQFRAFCYSQGLSLVADAPPMLIGRAVQGCWRVAESFIDLNALRGLLHIDLRKAGVAVHLNTPVYLNSSVDLPILHRFGCEHDCFAADCAGLKWKDAFDHDLVVSATYGRPWPEPLRYEVTENVLIQLGPHFTGVSLVVLDGEYCSLDPVPGTSFHMLYDVRHSVHAVGSVPEHLAPLLDAGPVFTRHSRMDAMLQTLRRFVRAVGMPTYHGSLFTIRAVLPDVDETDERPTLVRREGRVVHVLGGKLDTAVEAARQVTELTREAVLA